MRKLLVVSQENLPEEIVNFLEQKHWIVAHAPDAASALRLDAEHRFLVGLIVFPDSADPQLEARLIQQAMSLPSLKWVATLAHDQLDRLAIKRFIAERLYDFQVLPIEGARLAMILGHAYGMAKIEHDYRHKHAATYHTHFGLVGNSPVMQALYRTLQRAAESDVSVLITGPTGTGKELAARAIHEHSGRAKGPFVAINCAAIPHTLLQSELFGYEKGSFTNASARKIGYIQTASGGTLFLDEIGDMPLESQAILLRFLEDKIVTPLGSTQGNYMDVRVIASTNVDLAQAIKEKAFRADLYYRLAFLTVATPSLSSRGDDIELLAHFFLDEVTKNRRKRGLRFGKEALAVMRGYAWPGNIRELHSAVHHAAMSCEGDEILPADLKIRIEPGNKQARKPQGNVAYRKSAPTHLILGTLKSGREQSEKHNLEFALQRNDANVSRTARDLGISRMTLYRLMAKHGVSRSLPD
ncbi:hypothetical protein CCR95_18895 [Thiocystis minor]|uniref:sigma-54 dependent transcriptional regulator n=1 Tax=Thiocystis minor TaxID=61597 RepID=UPI001911967E|nr:sigma-54 dependent transcriptional regulator [Thiocystis minor]MBK5966090.1 hypothetical protein [Thiocystis minor]